MMSPEVLLQRKHDQMGIAGRAGQLSRSPEKAEDWKAPCRAKGRKQGGTAV
jgi:hypothetical protein